MLTEHGFEAMAQRIARLNNLPIELARNYMVQIGDTPELADDGEHVIVRDEAGAEVALILLENGGSAQME